MDFVNLESIKDIQITKIHFLEIIQNIFRLGAYTNKELFTNKLYDYNYKLYKKFSKYLSSLEKNSASSKETLNINKTIRRVNLIFRLNKDGKMPAINDKHCLSNPGSLKFSDYFINNDFDGFVKEYSNAKFFGDIHFGFYLNNHDFSICTFQYIRLLFCASEYLLFNTTHQEIFNEIITIISTLNSRKLIQKTLEEDPYITLQMPKINPSAEEIVKSFLDELQLEDSKKIIIREELDSFIKNLDQKALETTNISELPGLITSSLTPDVLDKIMKLVEHLDQKDIQIFVDFLTYKIDSVKDKIPGPLKLFIPKIISSLKNPESLANLLPTITKLVPGLDFDKIMNDTKLNETITNILEKKQ